MVLRKPATWLVAVTVFVSVVLVNLILARSTTRKMEVEAVESALQSRQLLRMAAESSLGQVAQQLAQTIEAKVQNPNVQWLSSQFQAVALLKKTENGVLVVDTFHARENFVDKESLQKYLTSSVKVPPAKDVHLMRFQADAGRYLFAVVFELDMQNDATAMPRWALGVATTSPLMRLGTGLAIKGKELFLTDQEGVLFAYGESQYVGSQYDKNPIVQNIRQSDLSEESGTFSSHSGLLVGAYEKVPGSNLFAVSSVPLPSVASQFLKFFGASSFIILIMSIIGLGLQNFLVGRLLSENSNLKLNLNQQMSLLKADPADEPEILVRNVGQEFASAVVKYLLTPATSVVGFGQMLRQRTKDKEIQDILQKSEVEARKIRDFIERLAIKLSVKTENSELVDIHPLMAQLSSQFRTTLTAHKIILEEKSIEEFAVRMSYDTFSTSLRTLFQFAIDQLEDSKSDKKIIFYSKCLGALGQIFLEVHGATISNEDRRQIFLPFQKTLKQKEQTGLDLAMAKNAMESAGGDIIVEPMDTQGFRFCVRLPIIQHVVDKDLAFAEMRRPKVRMDL